MREKMKSERDESSRERSRGEKVPQIVDRKLQMKA